MGGHGPHLLKWSAATLNEKRVSRVFFFSFSDLNSFSASKANVANGANCGNSVTHAGY